MVVRRNLFGSSVEANARALQELLVLQKKELSRKKRKWNFDFENEVPLSSINGIYDWKSEFVYIPTKDSKDDSFVFEEMKK